MKAARRRGEKIAITIKNDKPQDALKKPFSVSLCNPNLNDKDVKRQRNPSQPDMNAIPNQHGTMASESLK